MTADNDQVRVLALAAIFQAGLLAEQLATRGSCDREAARALIEGVLTLDPPSREAIYPDIRALRPGLELLVTTLRHGQRRENARPVGYALSLTHLANRLRKDPALMDILRNRLQALVAQRAHFADITDADFGRRLAGVYRDTVGTFPFRIRVHGEPDFLRNEDTAARIRALFLAGVRAAFLWRQCGGRRWQMLLARGQLLARAEQLISI